MSASVYIETTIVSYLVARPSMNVIQRAHQQITRKWWRTRRSVFDLFVSPFVIQEAGGGEPAMARRRLSALKGIPVLSLTPQALHLATILILRGPIPRKAETDALHIAIAAVQKVDYLMTWNYAHIANATMRKPIQRLCESLGYKSPVLCTPDELMEV